MAAPVDLPPLPDRTRVLRWLCLGGGVFFAVFAAMTASWSMAYASTFAAGLGWLLVVARRKEIGAHIAMAALDRAARGRYDEARSLLDAVSPKVLGSYVGQMVDSQRAALALYEGDVEASVEFATRAAREGKRLSALGRIHRGSALSLRAVALAGLGRKAESLADVAKVRGAEYRQASFLARASLAEAMLFAREKDLDSLAKVLRDDGALLFGATSMRERMIARALARMVAAKRVSVYREAAKRDEDELNDNDSWVARIAPEAASYAKAPKLGTSLSAPEHVSADVLAAAEKRAPKAKSQKKKLLLLWVTLVVLFLTIWQFLEPSQSRVPTRSEAPVEGDASPLWMSLVAFVGAGLFVAFKYVRAKKGVAALSSAMEKRMRGLDDEAREALEKLARSSVALLPPQAERELAALDTAAGEFRRAQTHAAAGIQGTRKTATTLALARPVLLPQLHGELALALAADGNVARAEEELEQLRLFPSYPFLARDTFRVRLVAAVASGRLSEAAEMARSRPVDLPLSQNEELLCDALRVHAGDPLPNGERERILLELREAPQGRFLDRVAPSLRAAPPPEKTRIADEPAVTEEHDPDDAEPAAMVRRL